MFVSFSLIIAVALAVLSIYRMACDKFSLVSLGCKLASTVYMFSYAGGEVKYTPVLSTETLIRLKPPSVV